MENLTAYDRFGWKLFNDETSLWSWHDSELDALQRMMWEKALYGRDFRVAKVTETEFYAYRPAVQS